MSTMTYAHKPQRSTAISFQQAYGSHGPVTSSVQFGNNSKQLPQCGYTKHNILYNTILSPKAPMHSLSSRHHLDGQLFVWRRSEKSNLQRESYYSVFYYTTVFGFFHCRLFLCTQYFIYINVFDGCFYFTLLQNIMKTVKSNNVLALCVSILISSTIPAVVVAIYTVVHEHMENKSDSNTLRLVHAVCKLIIIFLHNYNNFIILAVMFASVTKYKCEN